MIQIEAAPIPLHVDDAGAIRVSGTRVTLESIVWLYEQHQTVEQIHDSYPSIPLADIHAVIAYYLRHKQVMSEYLDRRRDEYEAMRTKIESQPGYKERREKLVSRVQDERQKRGWIS